ncbi:LPS assembly lipoprotein LptE [Palleronia sp. LCG004]|uniref:LPS assembly lipoprotein LptE n=1 Tax=Palleronia sp. LCG004 TaxID=3079304 RepID=UPI002941FEBF|nr:LPS assembly lipoprotein LptE [Palleronia sp. LCG004]WOI55541.1 LPS assembly lipoprotein LptE [Palleronia sp. LCG004]
MSWSDTARTCRGVPAKVRGLAGLLAAAALLAACGFTPVYGPEGAARGLPGDIAIATPRDVAGYLLVEELERRLGRAGPSPAYDLTADIDLDETGLGITADQETTRIRLVGELDYALSETGTGRVVKRGSVRNFTSYSAPVFSIARNSVAGNAVSVQAAEEDAIARLMVILADQLAAELLATAPDWRASP